MRQQDTKDFDPVTIYSGSIVRAINVYAFEPQATWQPALVMRKPVQECTPLRSWDVTSVHDPTQSASTNIPTPWVDQVSEQGPCLLF